MSDFDKMIAYLYLDFDRMIIFLIYVKHWSEHRVMLNVLNIYGFLFK